MKHTTMMRAMSWVAVGLLLLLMGLPGHSSSWEPRSLAAAEPSAATPENKSPAPQAPTPKREKARGRLPAYYGEVVTPEQREKIYAIQAEFNPKIEQLRQQIEALTKQRDEKIEALLTPEQKKKIEELRAAAKKSRAAKQEGKQKAAGSR